MSDDQDFDELATIARNGVSTSRAPAIEGLAPDDNSDVGRLRRAILEKLIYSVGKDETSAREHDWFVATALAVRDLSVDRWMASTRRTYASGTKRVYYLSLEFLIGRLLLDTLGNLGLIEAAREALSGLGIDLDRVARIEPDAALGNGGLGRLAACFMESMASLEVPAYGYGIRYDYGLFKQVITDGWQHEIPEDWLSFGNPWEFERPEVTYRIGFGGSVEMVPRPGGGVVYQWTPGETIQAIAFDTPVVGWRGHHVNTLRLWSARASDPMQLATFNLGDYVGAIADRARAEAISRVLYPSDATAAGQELRLRQEYFFTSASLQDLVRRHIKQHKDVRTLADHNALQMNDTHPAIAVAELMRILLDQHDIAWDDAWHITSNTLNYTNHTLLPEALESWPVTLMERVLPRHMQIIFGINWMHLRALNAAGHSDPQLIASVSLIDEAYGRRVRMGNLAFLGSRRVNGVSALHTDLMRKTVFRDFNALYPDRIVNKTNGITFRRWLLRANPELTRLFVEAVGEKVLDDPEALRELDRFAGDGSFQAKAAAIKRANKVALAALIRERLGFDVEPDAMFDVHIKRIHEYKRQLLNLIETVALYRAIKADPSRDWTPRVKIFAGKAAASYAQAKLIIRLAHGIAETVNNDKDLGGRLKLAFLPNYNVSLAEAIIPAADLSEQISTAGMEASGTGNMKLALNGALTIGTLDGANVEIREQVGQENIFIFGMTADQVDMARRTGLEDAQSTIAKTPRLAEALAAIASGEFSHGEPALYHPITNAVTYSDHFMVAADFGSYWSKQRELDVLWKNRAHWRRISVLNSARTGWFSSDRTIREYSAEIWRVPTR